MRKKFRFFWNFVPMINIKPKKTPVCQTSFLTPTRPRKKATIGKFGLKKANLPTLIYSFTAQFWLVNQLLGSKHAHVICHAQLGRVNTQAPWERGGRHVIQFSWRSVCSGNIVACYVFKIFVTCRGYRIFQYYSD